MVWGLIEPYALVASVYCRETVQRYRYIFNKSVARKDYEKQVLPDP